MIQIAYAVGGLWRHHPGLHSKVLGAAQAWEKLGAKVNIILFSEGRVVDSQGGTISLEPPSRVRSLESYYDARLNRLARFAGIRHQYNFLKEMLAKLNPDVLYSRYAMPTPGIQRAFGSSCPYVIEVNSDDLIEYAINNFITGYYNRFFRKSFLNGAAGLSFVSNEMASSESFSWYQGRKAVIANSIDCETFPFSPVTGNKQVNICFIGSPNQSWHGLDKIGLLSDAFPDWKFHIVGPDQAGCFKCGLVGRDNIVFHGHLSGEDAKNLLLSIDVGISTLALHRKHMVEASPLKSRQYLAQGIPFISGYRDTAICQQPFILELPNKEENIKDSIDRIRDFVGAVFNNSDLRVAARQFAESNLSCDVIEKRRLEFIVGCL